MSDQGTSMPRPPPPHGQDQAGADDGLQFNTAEYGSAEGAGDFACSLTGEPIQNEYYQVNGQIMAPTSLQLVKDQLAGGSKAGRFFKALALGFGAAVIGGLAWLAIRELTGYELGIVAVVVGLFVGAAVRKGANHRGGWAYRTLAILLTYFAISLSYVPETYKGIALAVSGDQSEYSDAAWSDVNTPALQGGEKVGAIIGTAIFSFVTPILVMFGSFILAIIHLFAYWEAWRLNAPIKLDISGPFYKGQAPPPNPYANQGGPAVQ